MRIYGTTREVLAAIEHLLAASKAGFGHSPLEEVVDLLCEGRGFCWAGIYLSAGDATPSPGSADPASVALPQSRQRVVVSIQLARREMGALAVETEREHGIRREDRVLLEQVATALARFLAGRGRYLVRRARIARAAASPRTAAAGTK